MAKNRLVVNHIGDSIELQWQRGQATPRFAPPVPFEHPFDEKTLGELRWYLEDYLRFPYGIEPDKAAQVEQRFQVWGQQLFELVFRSSEKAREFFQEATRERLEYCEIGINSDAPNVLNLPWELLYSPDYQFLAPSLAGMYRSLNSFAVRAELEALPQDKLNILLVIARPYGERDISLKTIARPMLEALKPIRQQVNLKVLRPPSFDEFQRELNAHKGFYHIVHFDGHGDFDPNSQGFQHSFGSVGQGVLVFEHLDGSPQVVTADQIAQNLRDCDVPIFILNACKSAQEGSGSFSSVATQLVSLGAKGVVAMAYSVHADAAKHFIGRLYEQLIQGASLDRAVADGRKEVLNQPLRPSPKGKLRLADWMVPVLYQQETYAPFLPSSYSEAIPNLDQFLKEPIATKLVELPEEGSYGFVGRDYDILRLERAFRQNKIVLLQGMGGVGKTELVCGFARWLDETQGRFQSFFLSFEHGAGLSHVINQVGRTVWGDQFSQYSFEQQQAAVLKYLKTNPCLLIWDNFEPVAGFPTGNESLLLDDERDELKRFLKNLRDGTSWVLITSRREERWLDCGYKLVHLQGLSQADAEEFAAKILEMVGCDRAKLPPEYLDLLKLLGGHPLSLRVVLPHLKTQSPTQLIEALRKGLDTFQETEEGKDKSLTVSLDYSFSRLSERTQKHLPFLALFSERVYAYWLSIFLINSDSDFGKAYKLVFEENIQATDWQQILDETVEAGILEHLGSNIYKVHPVLPWYLRQQLNKKNSFAVIQQLEEKLLLFYAAIAEHYSKQLIDNAETASTMLKLEEPNLLKNLYLAEQKQDWRNAQPILTILGDIYKRWGHQAKFKSLRQRALNRIDINSVKVGAKGNATLDFWMYLRNNEANEALFNNDLEKAKQIYQEVLDKLEALKGKGFSVDDGIATLNNNLGNVALKTRNFEVANAYYQKALNIRRRDEDVYRAAGIYLNLGRIKQEKGLFEDAIIHYQNALKIYEDSGDAYKTADVYYQLSEVAQQKRQFDKAGAYSQKALDIYENAKDLNKVSDVYHQLGNLQYRQAQYVEASTNYKKALKGYEDGKDWYNAADVYYQLGMVAGSQKQFDDAVAYFQKAFDVFQRFQDWYKVSLPLRAIGNVLEHQTKWIESLSVYLQALNIDLKYRNEDWINLNIQALGRIRKVIGENQFKVAWQEITEMRYPEALDLAIQAASENQEE